MLNHLPQYLRERTPSDPTRHGLVAEIELLSAAQSALDAYRHRVVAAIDALGDKGLDAAEVLRSVGRVSNRSARRVSKTAARMKELPCTAKVLAAGTITAEHADVMADAVKRVDPALVDSELLDIAASSTADLFAKRAREWVSARDSDTDIHTRQARQHRLRSVRSWTDDDGMAIWLTKLDPATAASVSACLETEYERLWREDGGRELSVDNPNSSSTCPRSPEQRMADAFVALMTRRWGANGVAQPHIRQQMLCVVDLTRMRTESPEGIASLADGTPLSQQVVERLACLSEITGIIFDGPGKPIWVGRSVRSANSAQWKALIARDRGCVGCGADPNRCEAHHIEVWNRGGPTDITNLVLVCSRCHHNIHDRGMSLDQSRGGRWTISPRAGPQVASTAA